MVDGKMEEKADKANRTARLGLHDKKRLPLPFPSGNFNVAGVWNKNGSPSMERCVRDDGGRCLFRGLDVSPTIIFSMVCRNLSPKPTADGGTFAGDVSSTIPWLSADNRRRAAFLKT
ncbi:hypothetical protein TcG_08937 [Trypanosoma cruzi]|nr:hypothetical protein TcG_08937 [Trypanosoma cruzi]